MGKVTLGEQAVGSPAITARSPESLLLVWTGVNSAHNLNIISSPDGSTFSGKVTLPELSTTRHAATSNGTGTAWFAWVGVGNLNLNVASTTDGVTYHNKVTLNEQSSQPPALAFGNGVLYLAWTGTDNAHSLNIMQSTDGLNWHSKVTLPQQATGGPGLVFSDGALYVVWTGTDAAHSLNMASTTNGGPTLNAHVVLGERSNFGPAIAAGTEGLVLAWTGINSTVNLNRDLSTNRGASWGSKKTFSDNSSVGPSLSNFANVMYISWTGTDATRSVNVATLETLPLFQSQSTGDGHLSSAPFGAGPLGPGDCREARATSASGKPACPSRKMATALSRATTKTVATSGGDRLRHKASSWRCSSSTKRVSATPSPIRAKSLRLRNRGPWLSGT